MKETYPHIQQSSRQSILDIHKLLEFTRKPAFITTNIEKKVVTFKELELNSPVRIGDAVDIITKECGGGMLFPKQAVLPNGEETLFLSVLFPTNEKHSSWEAKYEIHPLVPYELRVYPLGGHVPKDYLDLKSNKFVISPGADLNSIRAIYLEERLNQLSN